MFVEQPTECSDKDFEAAVQMEISAPRRGIKVRCLYAESCCQNHNLTPYIKRLVRAGEQARVLPQVPMNMLIIDNRLATFSLNYSENDVTVYAFRHPALVQTIIGGFEQFWQKGKVLTFKK